LIRRLRGVLGMAVAWATVFAGLGVIAAFVFRLLALRNTTLPPQVLEQMASIMLSIIGRFCFLGFVCGAVFAITIVIAERRPSARNLSSVRIEGWGMFAGALGSAVALGSTVAWYGGIHSPRIFANLLVILAIWSGVAGLGVAKAILTLARRRSGLGDDTNRVDPIEALREL
jgi:hypothetical protein